jgi:hypothetical protein
MGLHGSIESRKEVTALTAMPRNKLIEVPIEFRRRPSFASFLADHPVSVTVN